MAVSHAPDELNEVLAAGDVVSAYRIESLVGTGGMGSVYRATHVVQGHVAALKVLRAEQLRQDRAIDRMMREAHILAAMSHPGIPQLYECGVLRDRRPWIAMELVDGAPLTARMAKGPLRAGEVCTIVRDVASVLAAAHDRGVTHRDLKPDNILVTNDKKSPVRVIDWGIAYHEGGARYTKHDEALGTPSYMAPEQARGGPTDGYSDIYGLGIVAYQALAGHTPFSGQTSVEILVQHLNKPVPSLAPRCPDAPWGLVDLVERMLTKNPSHRPVAKEIHASLVSKAGTPPYVYTLLDDTTTTASDEAPTTQMRVSDRSGDDLWSPRR